MFPITELFVETGSFSAFALTTRGFRVCLGDSAGSPAGDVACPLIGTVWIVLLRRRFDVGLLPLDGEFPDAGDFGDVDPLGCWGGFSGTTATTPVLGRACRLGRVPLPCDKRG